MLQFEPEFKDVLVCANQRLRPFIEIFVQEPENVNQKNLGIIAGIFEITDDSEDSSYIVNYLISVIKKEYYAHPKRGPIESFESALHKANLALAKLAEHENVNWIGKLNANCIVLEKYNLHLSYTGTAATFLLRGKSLTDISERSEAEQKPNPLKTFQDVLSGRIDVNDKLIITTNAIFDLFSAEELKKSALKFTKEEFLRFLNTALVNELEKAAVLVIDINEQKQEESPNLATAKPKQSVNVFSQEAFHKKESRDKLPVTEDKTQLAAELKRDLEEASQSSENRKAGHIYIKEDDIPEEETNSPTDYLDTFREKLSDSKEKLFLSVKTAASSFSYQTADKLRSLKRKTRANDSPEPAEFEDQELEFQNNEPELEPLPRMTLSERVEPVRKKMTVVGARIIAETKFIAAKIAQTTKNSWVLLREKIAVVINNYQNNKRIKKEGLEQFSHQKAIVHDSRRMSVYQDKPTESTGSIITSTLLTLKTVGRKFFATLSAFIPSFHKLRIIYRLMDTQKKIYAALVIAAIFVVPYVFVSIDNQEQSIDLANSAREPVMSAPLENDKSVTRVESLDSVYEGKAIEAVVAINGSVLAIEKDRIIDVENRKEYVFENDSFKDPDMVAPMDDLNLVFLIKGNTILSFSPSSGKFQSNKISIPSSANIVAAETYLTYIYLLDAKNSQVYRYPRAEGGFGDKSDWIKDSLEIKDPRDLAINENVFVLADNNIKKFFRGKAQDYQIEATATPITPYKLYTKQDGQNLYILDKNNARVIKLDNDGKILGQYYHTEVGSAESFTIDEAKNILYFSSNTTLKKINLN